MTLRMLNLGLVVGVTLVLAAGCTSSRRGGGGGGEGEGEEGEGEGGGNEGEGEGEGGEGGEGEGEGEGGEVGEGEGEGGGGEGEGEGGGGPCSPGQIRTCTCSDGARWSIDCTESGQWPTCPCSAGEGEGEGVGEGEGEGVGEGEGEGGQGVSCYDIYQCAVACADQACMQACVATGAQADQAAFVDMVGCWNDQCADVAEADFSACVEEKCLPETNLCLSGGGEGEGEGEGEATCSDIYSCAGDCGEAGGEACVQACLAQGTAADQQAFADMITCWNQLCAEAGTNDEFVACVEQNCMDVTNACLSGGGTDPTNPANPGELGATCNCDSDCNAISGRTVICVLGICMTRGSAACSGAGTQVECAAGSRCWSVAQESTADTAVCWPDCDSNGCDGGCDSDGSCVPLSSMTCDPSCGAFCE